jgi:hypothetical protein
LALEEIGRLIGRRANAHEDLTGARHRRRTFLYLQHLRSSRTSDDDGAHVRARCQGTIGGALTRIAGTLSSRINALNAREFARLDRPE